MFMSKTFDVPMGFNQAIVFAKFGICPLLLLCSKKDFQKKFTSYFFNFKNEEIVSIASKHFAEILYVQTE